MDNHRTWIELNRQALADNLTHIQGASGCPQLALVVKSNAYGHGMVPIAQMAQQLAHVSWLCTAGLSEALTLRANGITKPLLVLAYLDAPYSQAVVHDIHCTIHTLEDAYELNRVAAGLGKRAFVHLKIDTGMTRLGFMPHEALAAAQTLLSLGSLELYGVFTHLCDTPNPDPSFSEHQLRRFNQVLDQLEAHGIVPVCTHALSSSGLRIVPERQYTFLRAGAAAYGIWKSVEHKELVQEHHAGFDLSPVMAWKTRIMHTKLVEAGTSIGYDRTYYTQAPTRIGVLPLGYWDGYARSFSNTGTVYIDGHPAPVVGIVSMNLMAVDITHCPQAQVGTPVLLLGGTQELSANRCARTAGLITNELVTRLNPAIPRIIMPELTRETDIYRPISSTSWESQQCTEQ